jgi:hypothetical protein
MFQTNNVRRKEYTFCVQYIFSVIFKDPANAGYHSAQNDLLEMLNRRNTLCTISQVNVADITFGEMSRHLEIRIKGHRYNLPQGLPEKSNFAQNAYEEGHKI